MERLNQVMENLANVDGAQCAPYWTVQANAGNATTYFNYGWLRGLTKNVMFINWDETTNKKDC